MVGLVEHQARRPFALRDTGIASGQQPAVVRHGLDHQPAEPEDHCVLSIHIAAVHYRSSAGAGAEPGIGGFTDCGESRGESVDRIERRADRKMAGRQSWMAQGAALCDGHGAGRIGGKDGGPTLTDHITASM